MKRPLLPALALLLLTQCQKADPDPTKPEDQLPPATQTGAHTFGCLLNGQPWTPSGNYGPANLRVTYDPGYAGGSLAIRVYQAKSSKPTQQILMTGSSISKAGTYEINNAANATCGASYISGSGGTCGEYSYYNSTPGFVMKGRLVISRLDRTQGIVSGTFAFTLFQSGCDSLKVTQGRFDDKF